MGGNEKAWAGSLLMLVETKNLLWWSENLFAQQIKSSLLHQQQIAIA